jgi:hypothetical protein
VKLLFLAGIPASGKSTFGRWLEANHGFVHIDPEEDKRLANLGLESAWAPCVTSADCSAFSTALRGFEKPVVFNWGFPVSYLPTVASLKRVGFSCWWFDADIAHARSAFLARKKGTAADFEKQVGEITSSRSAIRSVFLDNSVLALDQDGTYLNPEAIWSLIRAAA